jgi:hypothetical protein
MCKMFPYHVDADQTLQIEIVRKFEVTGMPNSRPEIIYDTPSNIDVEINSTVVLQCKCHSVKQVPKIQWFKQIVSNKNDEAEDQQQALIESISMREISFLENSYRPVASSGIKKLDDDIYLSKLIINNVTDDATYACAVINYFGYKYRNFRISVQRTSSSQENDDDEMGEEEEEGVEISFTQSDKSLELFFIPIFLLLVVVIQVSLILYLLVYRSIMRDANKAIT